MRTTTKTIKTKMKTTTKKTSIIKMKTKITRKMKNKTTTKGPVHSKQIFCSHSKSTHTSISKFSLT